MKIEEIKASLRLEDYIKSCGINLIKAGKDLKALCPFHNDNDPSLIVTPSKQLWNCPGCGKGGSIIDFAMHFHSTDIAGAVKILSKEPVISLKSAPKTPPHQPKKVTNNFEKLLLRTVDFYAKTFASVEHGKNYLAKRKITDLALLENHRIGFSDGSLMNSLPNEGKILDDLVELGVLVFDEKSKNYYERFKNCVVFPVCDLEGRIVTLYGRYTGGGKKRHVYLPERSKGYWNISAAKSFKSLYLVESIIDALSLKMVGIENVVSIQSVNVAKDLDPLLRSCQISTLYPVFDGDDAGKRGLENLRENLEYYYHFPKILPDNQDPNSILVSEGKDKLLSFLVVEKNDEKSPKSHQNDQLGKSTDFDGFSLNFGKILFKVSDIEKSARRLRATVRAEEQEKFHIDTVDFYSAKSRKQLALDLARTFDESSEIMTSQVEKLLKISENHLVNMAKKASKTPPSAENTVSTAEKEVAEKLGKNPEIITEILEDYEKCGIIGERTNKLLCYLAMTSRKMDDPMAVLILSSSGAGKTALQDAALKFCPPEDLVKLTSLSGKALFHKDEDSLKHKVLALEEGAGAEDASYAIRNLISSPALTSETTVRDPKTGLLTTQEKTVNGPTAVFCTTTNPDTDAETKSRFFVTGIDESRQQTRKILEFQRKRHTVDGLKENLEVTEILTKHRNFQRLLTHYKVVNPLAEKLVYDDDRLQSRRAQPQYLNLIKTVAFLRQMSKKIKLLGTTKYIEVDEKDVEIGNSIALEIIGKSLDELSIPARNLLNNLHSMLISKKEKLEDKRGKSDCDIKISELTFTRREARDFTGWNNTRLHNHVKELLSLEYLAQDSGRGTSLQTFRLLYNGEGQNGKKFIPGLKL